jgi:hypothetical protein
MINKKCASCLETKDTSLFGKDKSKIDGLLSYCKECVNLKNRAWYTDNKDKFKHSDKQWLKRNVDRVINRSNAYCKQRRISDPSFAIAKSIRSRLYKCLSSKRPSTKSLIGCSYSDLVSYLESLFKPGMSWANRSQWHIDHIAPLASFDLTDPEQFKKACHYTNLQPLWAEENMIKSDKLFYNIE